MVCAADDTVEHAKIQTLSDGNHVAVIDGAETVHHCRDSTALARMVKDSELNPIGIESLEPGAAVGSLAG